MLKGKYKLDMGLGVLKTTDFSLSYPELNKEIYLHGNRQDSRNGITSEVLDFKTILTNPRRRCVGGYGRNMNIFFLLAESMWIFAGGKDVKTLEPFNSNLKNYSDDGINYHAPYGYRLRNWGISSSGKGSQYRPSDNGYDQLRVVVEMLERNPADRRIVATIWNPDLDLNTDTKDLPCNDMLMWKVREDKLHLTIHNRSNDLHWGLTTNIFQFSFMNEIIAKCIGTELGNQTHNSQSLHIYRDNNICTDLLNKMSNDYNNIYDYCGEGDFDFAFSITDSAVKRFDFVTEIIRDILENLNNLNDGKEVVDTRFLSFLSGFSQTLFDIYYLLRTYVDYKNELANHKTEEEKNQYRVIVINKLLERNKINKFHHQDFYYMALNFYVSRITDFQVLKNQVKPYIPSGVGTF